MDSRGKKLIELVGIHKRYGSLEALAGVSLDLYPGELVSILGPSGCGKTTLLNIIVGITSPDAGKVEVAKDRRVGYVFQDPRLIPWKDVEDNILFVQKNYPLQKEMLHDIRKKLINKAGIEDFARSFPSQLSGGMKQRVSLIRALAIMPHILLLDEPFKSMDDETVSVIEEIILDMKKRENQGLIVVTHDYKRACRLSDRIYILSQRPGKIVDELRHPMDCFNQDLQAEIFINGKEVNVRRQHVKLQVITKHLNFKNWTPELGDDIEITGCHISDVMSHTLANASEGDLWITHQNNQVTVALASLKKIPAILLVGGKEPVSEMVDRANQEKIVVISTPLSCFEVAGRLYQLDFLKKKHPG